MDLPPLTGNIFSSNPRAEQFGLWLVFIFTAALVCILFLFWFPLRDTAFTYSLVAVTVRNSFALRFFQGVTILGSEGFFLVFLSAIYWSVNKSLGFWGLILMPSAIFITSEVPKDIIKLPRPGVPGITVPTYTFPSGHTSGAVSVWGFLAIMIKRRRFWFWAVLVSFLVGLSRVMLGYHFPGDVIGGVVTGILFLAFFFKVGLEIFKRKYHEKVSLNMLVFLALVIPFTASLFPATYAPNLMGYLAGATTGRLLEREVLNFDTGGTRLQHLARFAVGIFIIAVIILEVGDLLPAHSHLPVFGIHALSTFWVTFLAPLFFIKIGIMGVKSRSG